MHSRLHRRPLPCSTIIPIAAIMRVLISGGGIAGPTLAWFLAKTGARVTIVEKARALLPHGQKVAMQGSAITAVSKMGLLKELRKINAAEKGFRFIDPKGRPFAPFPVSETAGDSMSVCLTSPFEVLRGDLAAILWLATKDMSNIDYRLGTTVKEVVSNTDSAVQVLLSDGEI